MFVKWFACISNWSEPISPWDNIAPKAVFDASVERINGFLESG